jgi:hypothetical protein
VENNVEMPSLLPYLEAGEARFHLAFFPIFQDHSVEGKAPFPFVTIDPSGPLARIIRAQVVSDGGSKVKGAFVFVQQDICGIRPDPLRPFGNRDVEACWQRSFSHRPGHESDESPIVLSGQTDEDGHLLPFRSLFFCKKTDSFFHPPCPACGNALCQCYDDDLLANQGLQPYSTSLKRYLFCPTCLDVVGNTEFYVFELDGSDPSTLKDRWDLIQGFGRLRDAMAKPNQFPCLECSRFEQCYGADGLALSRVAPFCFYPFYMAMYPAMSLQAQDFLALLSGRSPAALKAELQEKQQSGRASCLDEFQAEAAGGFLFHGGERHFLEVLYLKLCFLDELFHVVVSRLDAFRYPHMGPSLDSLWVKLAGHGGLLPFLWNFKVKVMGPGGNPDGNAILPEVPPNHGLYFMAMVWFYALLVNKDQEALEIYGALNDAIEGTSNQASNDDAACFEDLFEKGFSHLLSPANIFWDPAVQPETAFDQRSLDLWKKALGMGWSLLMAAVKADSGFSKDIFLEDAAGLRTQVKEHLFRRKPLPTSGEASMAAEALEGEEQKGLADDASLYGMLANIAERWRKDLASQQDETGELPLKGPPGEMEETVILSAEAATDREPAAVVQDEEEDAHETVILSSGDFTEEGSVFGPTEEAGLEKTVILSPSTSPEEKTPFPSAPPGEGVLETVVISPAGGDQGKPGSRETKQSVPEPVPQQDDVPETVIMSPDGSNQTFSKPSESPEDDDLLAQTVIINTKKLGDKE